MLSFNGLKIMKKKIGFETKSLWKKKLDLKQRLTITPILAIPSSSGGYTMYYDASRVGLGCVLM
jgi:hypothetical protein